MDTLVFLHEQLFYWLYGISGVNTVADNIIIFFAKYLDWFVVVAGVLFILIHRHARRKRKKTSFRIRFTEGVYVVMSVSFGWLLSYIGKHFFFRPRPFIRYSDIEPLFIYGSYDSFPSGHATLFAALAVAIFIHHKRAGIIFIVLALLISLARVIAGVHFPIDIFAGWALGAISAYFVSTRIHA